MPSVFSLDAFGQILRVLLFLWARAGKVERELEQMALFLCGPWWPSTPAGSESSVSGWHYYQSCDPLGSLVKEVILQSHSSGLYKRV